MANERHRPAEHLYWPDHPLMPVTWFVLLIIAITVAFYRESTENNRCERECSNSEVVRCGTTYVVCSDGTGQAW